MTERIWLATDDGVVVVDPSGGVLEQHFAGSKATAVDARDGVVAVRVEGVGVQRRSGSGGEWESLGFADANVWTVRVADGGAVYAGLEPPTLWRLGDGPAVELDLTGVEGHSFWHSPWGPANVNCVIVEGDRFVVGVEVGGVAVSGDGGKSWDARNEGLYEDVHHVVADAANLYATTGMGFHRSTDEGRTWTWENDGIDRGYSQGLALCGSRIVMASASGPPPIWEAGGPEAAIFVADTSATPLDWRTATEAFKGNVERGALQAGGSLVVAATTAGELLVSTDGAETFEMVRDGLAPVTAAAVEIVS